jgi:hypothetical protein
MTTFLIDGETALDAGALTEALPLSAQTGSGASCSRTRTSTTSPRCPS